MTNTDQLAIARARARIMRGEFLQSLADGITTADDLIEYAVTDNGKPLLVIPLWKVIAAELGVGRTAAKRRAQLIKEVCGSSHSGQPTIGWLTDRRAGGRRLIAFADALRTPGLPWPGFPFTKKPGHEGAIK